MMDTVNTVSLVAGALPVADDECVVDARFYGEDAIGSTVKLSPSNDEDTLELFRYQEYRIVGVVNSVYLSLIHILCRRWTWSPSWTPTARGSFVPAVR